MQEDNNTQKPKDKRGNSCCLILFAFFGVITFVVFLLAVFCLGLFEAILNDAPQTISNSLSTAPVVVVPVEGIITDSRPMVKLLNGISENSSYKAVVIRIDSPGGSVGSSEEIYRAISRLRDKGKVVVASMGNAAASGGYYIACAADKIVTNGGTVTGSIGVISDGIVVAQLLDKLGVEEQVTASGKLKQVGTPMRHATPIEKSLLNNVINDMYVQFFTVVLKARGDALRKALDTNHDSIERIVELPDVATSSTDFAKNLNLQDISMETSTTVEAAQLLSRVADGRIITGRQAVVLGLADAVGGLNDAISTAGVLAKIGKNPRFVERKQVNRIEEWLSSESNRFIEKLFRSQKVSIPQYIAPVGN